MNTRTEELRWKQRPFPELVRLAWPIAVSMLSFSVMTLVDTLFAGRLGATALGAVGFGGIVTFTLLSFGIGLLRATKVIIAQAVGAGRRERIPGSVGAALALAVSIGAGTALVGEIARFGLHAVAEGSAAVRAAEGYVAIRLLGAPFVLVGFAIREARTALGDSRSPMRTALLANGLHIPLNAALIFGAGLGVNGAALSTVLAQAFETLLLCAVQRRDGLGLKAWGRRDVLLLCRLGWPLGLERLFNVGSFTVLVTLVARVSDRDLAAHQLAHQVNLFAILPLIALSEAAAVLSGQAVGAGEHGLVRRIARIGIATGLGYGMLCAVVYLVFGSFIAGALVTNVGVAGLATKLLWVGAAMQVFDAPYMVSGAVLRGAGDIRFATIAMVSIAWIVTPPLALLLGIELGLGALGGWLALLVEGALGATLLVLRVEGGRWLVAARRAQKELAFEPEKRLLPEPAVG